MKEHVLLFFKGVAMGASDVVPGVSGGTIAFITGIYEELLESIKSVNLQALKLLFTFRLKAFWSHINGAFLLPLFAGIATAIAALVDIILYLLENHPVLLWSFFFGLIIASAIIVAKQVKNWHWTHAISGLIGLGIAYYITSITTVATSETSLWYIFFCGSIAICAMILPGISGSFILLLMGAYQLVIGSIKGVLDGIKSFDLGGVVEELKIMGAFAIGAIIGLVSFSHVLSWLFKKYHDLVVTLLIGFLLGSLNKVWPWKQVVMQIDAKHAIQENVSPLNYEQLTGDAPQLFASIGLAILGFGIVYGIEYFASKDEKAV